MGHPFHITGIVWDDPASSLPNEIVLDLPGYLLDINVSDFEPENPALDDDNDEYDEDELDDWLDNYEPTDEAIEAFEQEWDRALRDLLRDKFGKTVVAIGSYEPAQATTTTLPWKESEDA